MFPWCADRLGSHEWRGWGGYTVWAQRIWLAIIARGSSQGSSQGSFRNVREFRVYTYASWAEETLVPLRNYSFDHPSTLMDILPSGQTLFLASGLAILLSVSKAMRQDIVDKSRPILTCDISSAVVTIWLRIAQVFRRDSWKCDQMILEEIAMI